MSTTFYLSDGTEFRLQWCSTGRPVLVGFTESNLEKLLRLQPEERIRVEIGFGKEEITYSEFLKQLGKPIAAYIPDPVDYLGIANYL